MLAQLMFMMRSSRSVPMLMPSAAGHRRKKRARAAPAASSARPVHLVDIMTRPHMGELPPRSCREEVVWKSDDGRLELCADGTVFFLPAGGQSRTPVFNAALELINRDVGTDPSIRTLVHVVLSGLPHLTYVQRADACIAPLHAMLGAPPRARKQLLVLQAMKGLGKSKCIREGVIARGDETVLNLTFRRVLARGVSKELGPRAASYLDYPSGTVFEPSQAPVLTILVNSLCRTQGFWDVIIIDEIVSVVEMLGSRLIDAAARLAIVRRLIALFRSARLVVVADAHNDADTLAIVRALISAAAPLPDWDVRVHDYTHRNRADYKYLSARTLAQWKQILQARLQAGQRVVVPCMTRRFALEVEADVRCRFPSLNVMCYVANPARDIDIESHMADVNAAWKDLDVLIYSPVITAGCSFEVPDHFDCCMMCAFQGTSSVRSAVQMTARVRSLRRKETIIFVDNARDCFGGKISPADEIVTREAWATAYTATSCARTDGAVAVAVIDMICAQTAKADNARRMRFESEFWKCIAWGGSLLGCMDIERAGPEAQRLVGTHLSVILDVAETCCVRPRIYATRRRSRRDGAAQFLRQLSSAVESGQHEQPRILRIIHDDDPQDHRDGDGDGDKDGENGRKGLPSKPYPDGLDHPDHVAAILTSNSIEFGHAYDQRTSVHTPCPESLRLAVTHKTVDDYSPVFGDCLARDAHVHVRHLEELGMFAAPIYRQVRCGAAGEGQETPDWVSQENAHVWQLASLRVAQKMVWEERVIGGVLHTRMPARCFSVVGFNRDADPRCRGQTQEQIEQHDGIPDAVAFERIPVPTLAQQAFWAKLLTASSCEAARLAWDIAANQMLCTSIGPPESLEDITTFSASVARRVATFAVRAAADLPDDARVLLLAEPHLGPSAQVPRHHGVHFALMGTSTRNAVVLNVCMSARKGDDARLPLYRLLPKAMASAAAFARTYCARVLRVVQMDAVSGLVLNADFSGANALFPSERLYHEFFVRKFITLAPLKVIFVLRAHTAHATDSASPNPWDVWWPEGGVKIRSASCVFVANLLRANVERGGSRAARIVTWDAHAAIAADVAHEHGDLVAGLVAAQVEDLAKHYEFLANSGPAPRDLAQVRPLNIVETNRAERLVHHAAGADPFPETQAHGPMPLPDDVPAACARLAQIYMGCLRAGCMAVHDPVSDSTTVVETTPFLRIGDITSLAHPRPPPS